MELSCVEGWRVLMPWCWLSVCRKAARDAEEERPGGKERSMETKRDSLKVQLVYLEWNRRRNVSGKDSYN